ncbi:MAG TPA: hypothetical protein H9958_02235 [Candidatus Limosilactobacillus intestinavium]|nr:hypothetical protein [Candidatus Limosilactobacillus intestinavium]
MINMNDSGNKKTNWILWVIAIVCALLAVMSIPNRKELNHNQKELMSVNSQISHSNDANNNYSTNTLKNVNVKDAEQQAGKNLSEGVAVALGGIHSTDDLKNNQKQLQQNLGKQLEKALVKHGKSHNTNEFLVEKNDSVSVGFGDATNPANVNYNIVTTYDLQGNSTQYLMISGTYNLETMKVNSFTLHNMQKQTPSHTTNSEDGDN